MMAPLSSSWPRANTQVSREDSLLRSLPQSSPQIPGPPANTPVGSVVDPRPRSLGLELAPPSVVPYQQGTVNHSQDTPAPVTQGAVSEGLDSEDPVNKTLTAQLSAIELVHRQAGNLVHETLRPGFDPRTLLSAASGPDPAEISSPVNSTSSVLPGPRARLFASRPNNPTGRDTVEFKHCTECELMQGASYKGCFHPNEDAELDTPTPIFSPLESLGQMLRQKNLASLLSENCDISTDGILLTTIQGVLISHDTHHAATAHKRTARMSTLTWRQQTAILQKATDHTQSIREQLPNVLKKVQSPTSQAKAYKSMIIVLDNKALALEYVKQGLLIAVWGREMPKPTSTSQNGNNETTQSSGESSVSQTSTHSADTAQGSDNPVANANFNLDMSLFSELEETATGLADYLREELSDFKMPSFGGLGSYTD